MTPNIGILLINLGTPDATDPASIKRYLKEFLSDPRVIEKRGLLWWAVLNGIIIPRRVKKSGRAYRLIWNEAADESPLRTITRAQAEKIGEAFGDDPRIMTTWAMRYGAPSIHEGIQGLANAGCDKVLVFPLYPQYSAATTASAMDEVFSVLKEMRWQPSIRVVPPYFDEPTYIETLAEHITRHEQALRWKPELCLASFHGLPVSFIEKGAPYQAQCETTIAHLRLARARKQDHAAGLSVEIQASDLARPGYGRNTGQPCIRRGQKLNGRCAGFCSRLHRNAGRNRDARQNCFHPGWRRKFLLHPVP